jgi:mannose/cellobiose epimerase-like protein (N-acyl-D-glucosamine 2-epimerase family)
MCAVAEGTAAAVRDVVLVNGRVKVGSSRLWPHTERIKAGLACFERSGNPRDAACAMDAFDALMDRYCALPVAGTWRDSCRPDGSFVEEASPASSFYHITLALSELIRVAAQEKSI